VKRVTMADVAARAGVSKATVSYALNDRPGLAASTRARALAPTPSAWC
jgi:DNA-binding LacI/PurR family transcriptional regulator